MTTTSPPAPSIDLAWGAGYDAYACGLCPDDNPYDPVEAPEAHAEWASGWEDADR